MCHHDVPHKCAKNNMYVTMLSYAWNSPQGYIRNCQQWLLLRKGH